MSKHFLAFCLTVVTAALVGMLVAQSGSAEPVFRASWLDAFFGIPRVAPRSAPAPSSPTSPASPYKATLDYEEAVINAVERGSQSVVSIVITKDLSIIERCPIDPFGGSGGIPSELRDFFGSGFFEFSQPCEKGTRREQVGGGSGFVATKDGIIVTNRHVVSDAKAEYTVLTNDGKKYTASVLARNPVQDLAFLKISATNLKPAVLGNSDEVRLGQTVIAIGNALGEFRNTVSVGVVSGLARNITAQSQGEFERIEGVIQTDAAINPGNSGGPLLNLRGEVMGVNTAIVAGAQNIGFAIPVNRVTRDLASIAKNGSIEIPYLGVRYLTITPEVAKEQKLPVEYGALVRGNEAGPAIIPGSPAAKAGIEEEDIIVSVNGKKISKDLTLGALVQNYAVGEKVTLEILRGSKTVRLSVTLEKRKDF